MSDRQELAEWWETFDGPAYPAGDEVADAILASDWLRQVKAEVWDEGFESGVEWGSSPSGPTGVFTDPPRNPHEAVSGDDDA